MGLPDEDGDVGATGRSQADAPDNDYGWGIIDAYAAGREEAPAVVLTNPPEVIDTLAVASWNHFPSATTFFIVGYEDLYPFRGDYDFNDLTVAYQVRYGLNGDGAVDLAVAESAKT